METDGTAPSASPLDGPIITQQISEQISRPEYPQVSFNYRSAANSVYGYLQYSILTIFLLVSCFPPT